MAAAAIASVPERVNDATTNDAHSRSVQDQGATLLLAYWAPTRLLLRQDSTQVRRRGQYGPQFPARESKERPPWVCESSKHPSIASSAVHGLSNTRRSWSCSLLLRPSPDTSAIPIMDRCEDRADDFDVHLRDFHRGGYTRLRARR